MKLNPKIKARIKNNTNVQAGETCAFCGYYTPSRFIVRVGEIQLGYQSIKRGVRRNPIIKRFYKCHACIEENVTKVETYD